MTIRGYLKSWGVVTLGYNTHAASNDVKRPAHGSRDSAPSSQLFRSRRSRSDKWCAIEPRGEGLGGGVWGQGGAQGAKGASNTLSAADAGHRRHIIALGLIALLPDRSYAASAWARCENTPAVAVDLVVVRCRRTSVGEVRMTLLGSALR